MAVTTGIITNQAMSGFAEVLNNEGWYIFPTNFSLSIQKGALTADRTAIDCYPVWYSAPITSKLSEPPNLLSLICTIPPQAVNQAMLVNEIYIWAEDQNHNEFLMAIAQPSAPIWYDPDGSLSFRILLTLQNADLFDKIEFKYTQTTEITEHNVDLAAHLAIRQRMQEHGIYMFDSDVLYRGQAVDVKALFDSAVVDADIVYKNSDGKYYKAIANGSPASIYIGIADTTNGIVIATGYVQTIHAFANQAPVYLSATVAGTMTTTASSVQIGISLGDGVVLVGTTSGGQGSGNAHTTDGFHASQTPAANLIAVANSSGKLVNNWLLTGSGNGLDSDTVDGFHASQTPTANRIPAANSGGKISNGWLNTGPGNGVDADTVDGLHATMLTPTGTIISFAGNSAPLGWLKADGSAISRTAYNALFLAIGITFGAGDGTTTFNIPDLRGEFLRGWDDARGIDTGRAFGTAQADSFRSHTHEIYEGSERPNSGGWLSSGDDYTNQIYNTQTTSATGGVETRPRNIALLFCIKY